jgi:transcriptional regulator with XRE-family HTH domain
MARAALKLTVREVAELAGVDKSTIVRIEAGGRAYYQNMLRLQAVFEDAGIVFIEPQEGVGGAGVRYKLGFDPAKTGATQGTTTSQGDDKGGLDALGWDWDTSEHVVDDEPLPPLDWTDDDKADQIEHWRSRPEAWTRLHEVSRQCLLRAMGVERL